MTKTVKSPLVPILKHSAARYHRRATLPDRSPAISHLHTLRVRIKRKSLDPSLKKTYERVIDELRKTFNVFGLAWDDDIDATETPASAELSKSGGEVGM